MYFKESNVDMFKNDTHMIITTSVAPVTYTHNPSSSLFRWCCDTQKAHVLNGGWRKLAS